MPTGRICAECCALLLWTAATAPPLRAAPVRDLGRTWDGPRVSGERYQSGFLDLGSYASNRGGGASARPDGSGNAVFQYHGFIEDALNDGHLKFLADTLFLTDRQTPLVVGPKSFDYLLGVASRGEHLKVQFDREEFIPLDISGKSYRYWDVRGSYVFNLLQTKPGMPHTSPQPGLSGVLSAGYFLHNAGAPARLDNSGLAFMRYRGGLNAALLGGHLLLRGDADFLTDQYRRRYAPADLDLALGAGVSVGGVEIMAYRKSRQALDRSGYAGYYLISIRKYLDSRDR